MEKAFKILTIVGSPHDTRSNTRAMVEDFVSDMATEGLELEHEVISLGRKEVLPCKGCWNCTRERPCPQSRKDDLEEIKAAMIDCDMLILASPVYTNQVSAQMKAFLDRLFTWCHIFPLLGKYSLAACTTGGEGERNVTSFLEKILATYGTYSLGTIASRGGLTPGFFPARQMAREKNRKHARRAAKAIQEGRLPRVNAEQRKMFKVMKRKITAFHAIRCMHSGRAPDEPKPSWLFTRFIGRFMKQAGVTNEQLKAWAALMSYEFNWWKDRGWLNARSFSDLAARPIPGEFNVRQRLLCPGEQQ